VSSVREDERGARSDERAGASSAPVSGIMPHGAPVACPDVVLTSLLRRRLPVMTRRLRLVLPPVIVFVAVTVLAELLVRTGVILDYILPPPSVVLRELVSNATLWSAAGQTGLSAVLALVLSTFIGILAAIALSSARWVERAFYPYAVFFQTVPIIAIAPLLVIYLGYGMQTIVASAFIVSLFPVLASTFTGLRSTDPALVDLFRLYGAGRWAALWKLRLPAALPSILTGLRVAAGLAVIGAIVGELIGGGSGLGDEIEAARTRQRADLVFAAILLAALLGLAMFAIINLLSRLLLRHWHVSEQGGE
jgi:NitT/TauT family transport system permease protein